MGWLGNVARMKVMPKNFGRKIFRW